MKTLIQIEWMKVRRYRTFWAFVLLFIVSLIGINYVMLHANTEVQTASGGMLNIHPYNFPQVWSTTAWVSGFGVILLGLLVIVLFTNEYTYKTHRQSIIDGLSRQQFMTAKWLDVLFFIVFTWILYVILTLVIADYSGNVPVFEGFYYAGYFLVKTALSLSVAFMFALIFKRSGLAIALYLAYSLLLENILRLLLNRTIDGLGDFLPLSSGSYLVSNPIKQFVPEIGTNPIGTEWFLLASLCYIVLFVYLSYRYVQKADL